MNSVSVRFYGPLNDFLPEPQRARRVTVARPSGSIKDAIEAMGVPHPEVDFVLVNAAPQSFGYLLHDGDDIAVYPRFARLDLGAQRLTGDPPAPVRFAADVHLGRLTALLRFSGFDTEVRAEDEAVAALAGTEQRVALTRDVGLLKRSAIRFGYWVRATKPDLQLGEVIDRFDLADRMQPFTRCAMCNGALERVAFDQVAGQLPPRVRASFRDFNRCTVCGRIYWPGTHYERLRRRLERARRSSVG